MIRPSLFIALTLTIPADNAAAAAMVEINHQKGLSRIYSDNGKGRMEMPGSDRYLIIDVSHKTLYLVKPSKQSVLDLSHFVGAIGPADAKPTSPSTLTPKGPGPTVAGYKTTQFDYGANDTFCGSAFVSKAALNDSDLRTLFALLGKIALQAESFRKLFKAKTKTCEGANEFIAADAAQVGLPMRIVDKSGARWSEVARIVKNAALPANAFTYPDNYKVDSAVRIRQRIQQKIQQHLPQINQLLKQIQESGPSSR